MRKRIISAPLSVRAVLFSLLLLATKSGFALPLSDILNRIAETSPVLAEARAELEAARAEHSGSRAWPNPTLVGGQEFLGADEEPVEARVGIEQELGFLWAQRSRVQAARFALEAAEARFAEVTNDLVSEVIVTACEFDGYRRLRSELETLLESARDLKTGVEARHQLGDISRYDLERFAFEILHLEQELLVVEAEEQASLGELVRLSGISEYELAGFRLHDNAEMESNDVGTLDSWLILSREQRALLKSATLEEKVAKSRHNAALSERLPGIGIAVGRNFAESGDAGMFWEAGLEIPLFGQRRSTVKEARAKLYAAKNRRSALDKQVEQEVSSAYRQYRRAHETFTSSADSLFIRARENIERGSSLYLQGELSVFELVDVLNSGYEAQIAAIELRNARMRTKVELRRAAGTNLKELYND